MITLAKDPHDHLEMLKSIRFAMCPRNMRRPHRIIVVATPSPLPAAHIAALLVTLGGAVAGAVLVQVQLLVRHTRACRTLADQLEVRIVVHTGLVVHRQIRPALGVGLATSPGSDEVWVSLDPVEGAAILVAVGDLSALPLDLFARGSINDGKLDPVIVDGVLQAELFIEVVLVVVLQQMAEVEAGPGGVGGVGGEKHDDAGDGSREPERGRESGGRHDDLIGADVVRSCGG